MQSTGKGGHAVQFVAQGESNFHHGGSATSAAMVASTAFIKGQSVGEGAWWGGGGPVGVRRER